jgi:hypothetical protein
MKEATNGPTNNRPTEAEVNNMYRTAWQDFQLEAEEAKQTLDRRYARMVNHFGSYKQMPQEVKDMFKEDYAAHKAKWGKDGEEQQKRFGKPEVEHDNAALNYKSLADEKEAYLKKLQQAKETSQTRSMEYER